MFILNIHHPKIGICSPNKSYRSKQPKFSQPDSSLLSHPRYPYYEQSAKDFANPRQHATIYDGKIFKVMCNGSGRQTTYAAGTTRKYTPGASGSNTGKQRTCYLLQLQAQALVKLKQRLTYQADGLDAYDSDCIELNSVTKIALLWPISQGMTSGPRFRPISFSLHPFIVEVPKNFHSCQRKEPLPRYTMRARGGLKHTKACFLSLKWESSLSDENITLSSILPINGLLAQAIDKDIVKTVVNLSVNANGETVTECQKCLETLDLSLSRRRILLIKKLTIIFEQGLVIAALKNELRKLKGKAIDNKETVTHSVDPKRVRLSTSASGSQPSGNTKNDRILQTPSSNSKNKVEAHPRNVKSSLNTNDNGTKLIKVTGSECCAEIQESRMILILLSKSSSGIWTPVARSTWNGDRSQLTNFVSKFLGRQLNWKMIKLLRIMGFGDLSDWEC
ncbi:hypothetical protein Tco_0238271 [Tanacetum coccineum]